MKKKILAIVICAVMVLTLVACGDKSSSRETRSRRDRDRDRETTAETTEETEETVVETTIETTEATTRETRPTTDTAPIDDEFNIDDFDLDDLYGDALLDISELSSVGQRYANALTAGGFIVMSDDTVMEDYVLQESFVGMGPYFFPMVMYMRASSTSDASAMYDDALDEMGANSGYSDDSINTETRGSTKITSIDMGMEGFMVFILDNDVVLFVMGMAQDDVADALQILGY